MSELTYKEKIQEIAEIADKILNEWEINFIESVSERDFLTQPQKDIINKLYQRACESPY